MADTTTGARLWSQAPRLRLLFTHLAGRALRRRVELDDLVQETFLRALAHPERLPPTEPGEAALVRYLTVLARHAAVDCARALRARGRDARHEPLVLSAWSHAGVRASELAHAGSGPATRAAGADDARALERAFARLAPEHRRVIGLRQLEGLSALETARRMGRSESAVHSLYRRALLAWEAGVR
jgi:RNA polymerase sigma-70 factor (ECF subfamily)